GGAHHDHEATAAAFREVVSRHLDELEKMSVSKLLDARYEKFRNFGEWSEGA
ncbi:MAG: acetyl-CoA carboxylase carboxyl transferase subunit alpha, partial [Luteolibacter sp.]